MHVLRVIQRCGGRTRLRLWRIGSEISEKWKLPRHCSALGAEVVAHIVNVAIDI